MTATKCDICERDLKGKPHVDGATRFGPWANMCIECHKMHGRGLGLGKGQKYDGNGKKVEATR